MPQMSPSPSAGHTSVYTLYSYEVVLERKVVLGASGKRKPPTHLDTTVTTHYAVRNVLDTFWKGVNGIAAVYIEVGAPYPASTQGMGGPKGKACVSVVILSTGGMVRFWRVTCTPQRHSRNPHGHTHGHGASHGLEGQPAAGHGTDSSSSHPGKEWKSFPGFANSELKVLGGSRVEAELLWEVNCNEGWNPSAVGEGDALIIG
jgi:hypothetical protein